MITKRDAERSNSSEVRTVLQYLADSARRLRGFYIYAVTVGVATNRLGLAYTAVVLPMLPQFLMFLLSVLSRDAVQVMGTDFSAHATGDSRLSQQPASDGEERASLHRVQLGPTDPGDQHHHSGDAAARDSSLTPLGDGTHEVSCVG